MSDNRRRIAALRAKADSTTFPAEAASLRAKADELAKQEPGYVGQGTTVRDVQAEYARRADQQFRGPIKGTTVRFEWTGTPGTNFFEQMGGVIFTASSRIPLKVQVTDINGRTYWTTVE